MRKLKIELKQHTPIIQFQGEQYGATLRATEIKPKLDKFLIKHIFKEFDEYKKYLIGYKEGMNEKDFTDKKTLNYKLRIISSNSISKCKVPKGTSFYFSNMGESSNTETNFLMEYGETIVEFFSLNQKLINAIDLSFNDFLLINNFGFRQNKTFGSYTAKRDKRSKTEMLKKIKELKFNKKIYYLTYDENTLSKKMRDDAAKIYQYMKSGISVPKREKEDSYLFNYMQGNKIVNEKEFIIDKFFTSQNHNNNKKQNSISNKKYRYVRSVLGISNFNDYRKPPNNFKKSTIYYESEIKRYKSPILFKIIDNILIIIPEEDESKDNIYNKQFEFKKKNWKNGYEIKTPSKDEFNLEDFLECFFNTINNNTNFKKKHKLSFIEKIEVI